MNESKQHQTGFCLGQQAKQSEQKSGFALSTNKCPESQNTQLGMNPTKDFVVSSQVLTTQPTITVSVDPNSIDNLPCDDFKIFEFSDQTIRAGFIRKVYSILMIQLLVTLGIMAIFVFHEPTRMLVRHNLHVLNIIVPIIAIVLVVMTFCTIFLRKAPWNFIHLSTFTLCLSLLLGIISSLHNIQDVLVAVGLTAIVCFGLTVFAFQTKYDFTILTGTLFIAIILLILFGLIVIPFPSKLMMTIRASLGALLFSIYLIYDTQLIMGGNHRYTISPEEYIFAALVLYLDVINIFLYILRLGRR